MQYTCVYHTHIKINRNIFDRYLEETIVDIVLFHFLLTADDYS